MMFNAFSALTSKIYGALAIAAIVFAGVQTVRIDGLWFIDAYVDKLADANDTIKQMGRPGNQASVMVAGGCVFIWFQSYK